MQAINTLFVVLAVTVPLAAQEATKTAAAPAPHIVVDTVGPDGWRVRLGPTNLGNLLASEKGRALWQPGVMPLLGAWQLLVGDEAQFAAARDRLLGYGGRVRLVVQLVADEGRPRPHLALLLDGDGRTDMKVLAADLRQLVEQLPGEWQKETVDGQSIDVRAQGDEVLTAPQLAGDRIVIAHADGGRVATALALAPAVAVSPPPPPISAALRIDVDIPALVALAMADEDDESRAMMRAFGLESLGAHNLTIGTAGPHVQLEMAQTFGDKPAGLFAALCPTSTGVPALQATIGDGATTWKVGRFDWRALYNTIKDVMIASGETAEEFAKEVTEQTGIDPDADLLAHATDELLLELRLGDLERIEDAAWLMTVGLRDAAAFDKGLQTLLEHSKPVLTRAATTKAGDVDMHRYGVMFGYDIWMAVAHGRLLVAGGRDAEESLSTCLAKAADKEGAAKTPASDAFRELQKQLPPGTNGLARGDFHSMLALPAEAWFGLLPRGVGDPQEVDSARESALELLRTHNLATVHTATGYAERTWRWRLYW